MRLSVLSLWFANHRKQLMWWPLGIGTVIALFAPTDVLQYTWAKSIVNIMSIVVPMIKNLDAHFELSQVAQLYFSVMWMCVPVIFYSIDVGDRGKLLLKLQSNKSLFWWIIIFFGLIWLFGIYFLFCIGPDPFWRTGHDLVMLHSRVGMAAYGGVIMSGFVALPKLLIQVGSCFPDIYLQRSEK